MAQLYACCIQNGASLQHLVLWANGADLEAVKQHLYVAMAA
jgi:hypothetical protein